MPHEARDHDVAGFDEVGGGVANRIGAAKRFARRAD
jgi:hypothetical protein